MIIDGTTTAAIPVPITIKVFSESGISLNFSIIFVTPLITGVTISKNFLPIGAIDNFNLSTAPKNFTPIDCSIFPSSFSDNLARSSMLAPVKSITLCA